ncbi:MAG: endonuclease/exonuclease/phosphatase family protein, partial [Bacillota bacterium]
MRLMTWNVQWCRGVDGRVDPARIAAEAKRIADPDVVCMQEIAQNFPELEASAGEDDPAELARALPGYHCAEVWGV